MLKNDTESHIITSVCIGILACKYGIYPTSTVTTDDNFFRAAIEQSSLVWFNFIGGIMYPLNGI